MRPWNNTETSSAHGSGWQKHKTGGVVMVSRLILGFILVTAFSIVGMTVNSENRAGEILWFGIDGAPGLFCEVEKADVCGDGANGGRLHEARRSEGGYVWSGWERRGMMQDAGFKMTKGKKILGTKEDGGRSLLTFSECLDFTLS